MSDCPIHREALEELYEYILFHHMSQPHTAGCVCWVAAGRETLRLARTIASHCGPVVEDG